MSKATTSGKFSAEEKAAMKARAKELKIAADQGGEEAAVLAAIEEMPEDDKDLATSLHRLVHEVAPDLVARTWYGMPAYATPASPER